MSDSYTTSSFYTLNRRYMRSEDCSVIMYGGGGEHVMLNFDQCTETLAMLDYRVTQKTSFRHGAATSKETKMYELIMAQLSDILVHWRKAVADPAHYRSNKVDPGICIHTLDIDMCEGLDTLKALEDKADEMGIPNYTRLLVPFFQSEPCKCTLCAPSIGRRRWFWQCAQKYFATLPPTIFERMFSGLRVDAENAL
ncbi:hypothetical protein EXIGLDRAFT_774981 [Exidia glandulosa HHB12029]|uniref:Uncharacterized protein n=1 Tax=Exidia glandulosa HHB12029 TaxID=1314781 RepID=A0A165E553_EXIGL|nr:hypothetical protein EXIGLDRAFT_774981 [Exidia glandulosa HHB12029]